MKSIFTKGLILVSTALAMSQAAHAYPVIDEAVPVGGLPIAVYHDYSNPNVYWYIPQSIEPWKRDNQNKSVLFEDGSKLGFVFRGQASVEDSMLDNVAKSLHTSRDNLMPIAYDSSSNLVCQNFFMDDDKVSWKFPTMIGNYLEVVPVSIRTTNPSMVKELKYYLTNGGLGCTVEVKFKGVSTGYKLKLVGDYDKMYTKFEAAAHAEGFWWEVDLHTMIENLRQSKAITITSLEDESMSETELDKKIKSAADAIIAAITKELFTPALKLPQGDIVGRGKAWSLRADYKQSHESNHLELNLDSKKVQLKQSQISLRLSVD